MGNVDSGNWREKKGLVENALSINAGEFATKKLPGLNLDVVFRWLYPDERRALASLAIKITPGLPGTLKMYFKLIVVADQTIPLNQNIAFFTTIIAASGGLRWWIRCPRCHEKKDNLYFPIPGGTGFFCQTCSNLTHRSAQLHDKRFDAMKKNPELLAEFLREALQSLDDPKKAVTALRKIQMMK